MCLLELILSIGCYIRLAFNICVHTARSDKNPTHTIYTIRPRALSLLKAIDSNGRVHDRKKTNHDTIFQFSDSYTEPHCYCDISAEHLFAFDLCDFICGTKNDKRKIHFFFHSKYFDQSVFFLAQFMSHRNIAAFIIRISWTCVTDQVLQSFTCMHISTSIQIQLISGEKLKTKKK